MQAGDIQVLVATLVLPPAGPLLLALAGLALALRWRRRGLALALAGVAALWLLSTHALAVRLTAWLLPLPAPVTAQALQPAGVQAVVVLGGGVLPAAGEYGAPQPSAATMARLRYGIRLARASGLPLAFAGGVGWSGQGTASEAEAAVRSARADFGQELRWVDGRSRDTRENARQVAQLLQPEGVRRIALVSDAWHLPRAVLEFERAGFEVVAAPTRQPQALERPLVEWLPSAYGLDASRAALREWLALRAARSRPG